MRVLFVSAECDPLYKVGGLGEVTRSLACALRAQGEDIRVLLPWYAFLDRTALGIHSAGWIDCAVDGRRERFEVGEAVGPEGLPVYLLRHPRYLRLAYGGRDDYEGNLVEYRRFWAFDVAATEFIQRIWCPDIVHCHDHHTGLIPGLLASVPARPKTVFTLHNGYIQGSFYLGRAAPRRLDRGNAPLPKLSSPRARYVNFVRRAILAADVVTTVSPTYAAELGEPGRKEGLADLVGGSVVGIVNGIDARYDARDDPTLARRFDAQRLGLRVQNKRALQKKLGLRVSERAPLFTMVCRLDEQKGFELLPRFCLEIARLGAQVAVLGNGPRNFRFAMEVLGQRLPGAFSYRPFRSELETSYYAGGDFLLAPSKWEPCGIAHLKGYRYGCVPVARATGGLADTIVDYRAGSSDGTGFLFRAYDASALFAAAIRAIEAWRRPREWHSLQRRVMAIDSTWTRSARAYRTLHAELMDSKRGGRRARA